MRHYWKWHATSVFQNAWSWHTVFQERSFMMTRVVKVTWWVRIVRHPTLLINGRAVMVDIKSYHTSVKWGLMLEGWGVKGAWHTQIQFHACVRKVWPFLIQFSWNSQMPTSTMNLTQIRQELWKVLLFTKLTYNVNFYGPNFIQIGWKMC
jgi:hypothetical protein